MADILLIEDGKTQAIAYQHLLGEAGYAVRHAATAEEGFRLCAEATPDLVVLDQYLGEKSGLEICRRIKGDVSLQVIPILVLTASQKECDHVAALDAGADRFLSKQTGPEQLLAMIHALLASTARLAPLESDADARAAFSRGGRVLVMDDSRTYLSELTQRLTEHGFQVRTADSGQAGLDLFEQEPFHIAVVDVVLPQMDGFEVCRRARRWAEEHQQQVGLLMLSGKENRETLIRALESGADDFVSKSQDLDVITAHISSLVRRVRMMRHIQAIHQKTHAQQLALREAEWQRAQAEERAKNAEARSALFEELKREIEQRQGAEAALRDANETLETRVRQRTAELAAANRHLQEHVAERARAEVALRLNEQRLAALLQLNQMAGASVQEITDFALEAAVRLTGSTLGYLAFMNADETVLTMHSWSKTAMAECAIIDKPIVYPVETTGLWGEAVRQRKPIITNDYQAAHSLKKGYPDGHVHVVRHMNLPVFDGSRIVLVAGVGNKRGPYDESDVRQLTLLMQGMWQLLVRKRAEDELQKVRNYLANIIDSMPSVLAGTDVDGRVTQWNSEATRVTGVAAEQALGQPISRLLPDFAHWIDDLRAEVRQRRPVSLETLPVEKGDEQRFYNLMFYPLVADGVEGAVVRIEDVTQRARLQELMIQTEKIMSVGGLAAGIAHEINNPLGIISQAAQNIQRRVAPGLPGNQAVAEELGLSLDRLQAYHERRQILEFIRCIREASARAARIVANMLQFSRRQVSAPMQPASLAALMDQAVELAANDFDLKKKYDFRNIEIVREYASDLGDVPVLATEIQQVVFNLLKNAAQAMSDAPLGHRPCITLRTRREARWVVLEVEDNGPGMEDEGRRRVFEPFFTTKEPGVGTGLGLYVAYMIVASNHRGRIAVESSPGHGARFTIRLPLRPEEPYGQSSQDTRD
jgi:PAS domain S-box-containing protein